MTEQVLESEEYETVSGLIDSAPVIGTGVNIIKFIYEFGKTSPIEYAIDAIRREIDLINTQLEDLSGRLDTVTQKLVKVENLARIRSLQEHVTRLKSLGLQIKNNPADQVRAAEAAAEAGSRADTFLLDTDLWLWSDVRTITPRNELGQPVGPPRIEPVEPDFKTALALPVYSMALVIWIAAMMIDTGSDRDAVLARYGEQLDRHLIAVSVRSDWSDDGSEAAVMIAERIRSRIQCEPIPVHKYAQNGVCEFAVQCNDAIARTRRIVREFSVTMPDPGTVLCTIDLSSVVQDEREVEDAEPTVVSLGLFEEMLRSIVASGHLPAEQFVGEFPGWTAVLVGMYGVDRDLNLDYFTQILPSTDGSWNGPLRVGTSWNFEAIVPGGSSVVLAKQTTGDWLWYWHSGSEHNPPTDEWEGPNPLGPWSPNDRYSLTTWEHFGGGWGVVYGIVSADESEDFTVGDLYWNCLEGYETGQGQFSTPQRIGNGWNGLSRVFCGGEGVIYGVRPTGVLRWYLHTGWRTGANTWAEPRDLETNIDWRQFERIVPAGQGVIYGVQPNGLMRCYRHLDWRTGGNDIEGPLSVGDAWRFYRPLFAELPGATNIVVK